MSRRQLYADLHAVRVLVADGRDRLDGTRGTLDEFWLNSARDRLREADELLLNAAGGWSGGARTVMSCLVVFPVIWGIAAGGRALGLAAGWVIAAAVLGAALMSPLLSLLNERLGNRADQRRMARTARPPRPGGHRTEVPDELRRDTGQPDELRRDTGQPDELLRGTGQLDELRRGRVGPGHLAEVPDELLRARVRLVSAALRRAGSGRWTVPVLVRLASDDRPIIRLAAADRALCQAVDFLEIHLAEQRMKRAA